MNTKQVVLVVIVLICTFSLINWMRTGSGDYPISQTLPILGGESSWLYTPAGLVVLAITASGLARMRRK